MKKFLFLSICCALSFNFFANAQSLRTVTLDTSYVNFMNEEDFQLVISPGDTLQFESTGGHFAIYIMDAFTFLKIKQANLPLWVNSSDIGHVKSGKYLVITPTIDDPDYYYVIFCVNKNTWAAPPRIIVRVQQ